MNENKLYMLEFEDEKFFIKKERDGKISFHVGYTETKMSVKEAKKLIEIIKKAILD